VGKTLMLAGAALLALGALLHFAPGALSWFGKLPGDLRYESESTKLFVPITSMLIVSAVLSIALHLLRR